MTDYDIAQKLVALHATSNRLRDEAKALQRDLERLVARVDPTLTPRTAVALGDAMGTLVSANLVLDHASSKISLAMSPAVQEN